MMYEMNAGFEHVTLDSFIDAVGVDKGVNC